MNDLELDTARVLEEQGIVRLAVLRIEPGRVDDVGAGLDNQRIEIVNLLRGICLESQVMNGSRLAPVNVIILECCTWRIESYDELVMTVFNNVEVMGIDSSLYLVSKVESNEGHELVVKDLGLGEVLHRYLNVIDCWLHGDLRERGWNKRRSG